MHFFTEEHLVTWTDIAAGVTRRENFANIAGQRGDLRGFLTGIDLYLSGSLTEDADADLPKELVWNLLNSISLKGHLHEWLSSMPGWVLTVQNLYDELWTATNADLHATADLGQGASQEPYTHCWHIPIAPKFFHPTRLGQGPKDGMFPLSCMGSKGSLEVHTCSDADLTEDWAWYSTATLKVVLHEYWTDEVHVPAPWNMRTWTDSKTDVDAPGEYGAIDSCFMVDDSATVAVTAPTGDCRFKVDGTTIFDNVTGVHLQVACNVTARTDSYDDVADNGLVPIRWPQQSQSMFDVPTGRDVLLANFGVAHVAAAGTPRYVMRRFTPPTGEQLIEWPKLQGYRFDPRTERGQLRVANKAAGQGVPADPEVVSGASFSIAGSAKPR